MMNRNELASRLVELAEQRAELEERRAATWAEFVELYDADVNDPRRVELAEDLEVQHYALLSIDKREQAARAACR